MKNIFVSFVLFCSLFSLLSAQQDALYTQYLFSGQLVNPAYVGSKGHLSATSFYRHQWAKIQGAPKSFNIAINGQFRDKNGWGSSIESDRIGMVNQLRFSADYSYSIPTKLGKIAMGLRGTIFNYKANYSEAVLLEQNDQVFGQNLNIWRPNFGTGIYLYDENYFVGISIPHLLNNSLKQDGIDVTSAKETRHYYASLGGVIKINNALKIRPSAMLRYAQNSPIQLDINTAFVLYNRIILGGGYRTRSALYGNFVVQVNNKFKVGYSYDYATTAINSYSGGTHEVMLGYDMSKNTAKIVTPRFF